MKIKIQKLGHSPKIVQINRNEIIIGRGEQVDLLVDEGFVSRQHLKVHFDGHQYQVQDLGSKNGTTLDGSAMKAGELITISPEVTLILGKQLAISIQPDRPAFPYSPQSTQSPPSPLSPSFQHAEVFGTQGFKKLFHLYNTQLKNQLHLMENNRKSILSKIILAVLLFCCNFITTPKFREEFSIPFFSLDPTHILWIHNGCLILGFLFIYKIRIDFKKYRLLFKEKVVEKIFSIIDNNWKYSPDDLIASNDYDESGLFKTKYDIYSGDDLVQGTIDKTQFRFSEIHTMFTTKDSKGNRRNHSIFKGVFLVADFNKNIHGETYVLPDRMESTIGSVLSKFFQSISQKLPFSHGQLIKMENIEFEKKFVVYATDQVEARYILTPKIMEVITNLEKKIGRPLHLSFKGDHLYMAISYNKNLFEPNLFSSGVRFRDLKSILELFGTASLIINQLELNQRIWTKA